MESTQTTFRIGHQQSIVDIAPRYSSSLLFSHQIRDDNLSLCITELLVIGIMLSKRN
jgi:hypothetical protein